MALAKLQIPALVLARYPSFMSNVNPNCKLLTAYVGIASTRPLDTLYEPNAVCSQFLGSASMTFFSLSFPWFLFLSCSGMFLLFLSCLVLSFLSFPFSFFRFLVFSFLSFIFFSFLCFFFPIGLRLSCVCVVIGTTCKVYVAVFHGWQAV